MNANLFDDIPFDSEDAWGAFQINHGVTHHSVYRAILAQGKIPFYLPLFEFPRLENSGYLNDHYQVHRSQARLLGISQIADISIGDFEDPSQFANWLKIHAQIHAVENQVLGL